MTTNKITELPLANEADADDEMVIVQPSGLRRASVSALALGFAAALATATPGFPGNANLYGPMLGINPAGMAATEGAFDSADNTFVIAPGTSSDLRFQSGNGQALTPGQNFICKIEVVSGTFGAGSTLSLGTNRTFTLTDGFYVFEGTVPAGVTAFAFDIDNGSAVDELRIRVEWSVGPADADPTEPQPEAVSLAAFMENGGVATGANLWPKSPLSVASGDSLEDLRADGLALQPGETYHAIWRIRDTNNDPAFADRVWLNLQTGGNGQGIYYASPLTDYPGYWYSKFTVDPAAITVPSIYIEQRVDNAFTIAVAPNVDIVVELQLYTDPLPSFETEAGGGSAAIFTNPLPGILAQLTPTQKDLFVPGSKPGGDRGTIWRFNRFTGLPDASGGTTANCTNIQHIFEGRIFGPTDFVSLSQLSDANGQEGLAIYRTADPSKIIGFEAHGRGRQIGETEMWADGRLIDPAHSGIVPAHRFDLVTKHILQDFDIATDLVEVTALYRFDARRGSMQTFWWLKILSTFDSYATYIDMLSLKLSTANRSRLIEKGWVPRVSGSGGHPLDLDARRTAFLGDNGYRFDIAILESSRPIETWDELTGQNLKSYKTLTPLANNFRLATAESPRPGPTTLIAGETLFAHTETVIVNGN